jgi:hypothetical protein
MAPFEKRTQPPEEVNAEVDLNNLISTNDPFKSGNF